MRRKKKIDRAVDDVECPVECGCNAHATADFCLILPVQDIFPTMSSDELKKD